MFVYEPNFIPANFVVIGAGGNGSRLVPLLAQFLKTVNWIQPKIHIIDFDTVEDKNLLRQNFIKPDVGRPKAAVLAQRYGTAFDIDITAHVMRIEDRTKPMMEFMMEGQPYALPWCGLPNCIYLLCVDSVKARKDIVNALLREANRTASGDQRNRLIIDAGNENDYGQIVVSQPVRYKDEHGSAANLFKEDNLPGKMMPFTIKIPFIPFAYDFYDTMTEAPKTASCADLDQTLAINATMATAMMGIVQNFVYRKPLGFHRLNINLQHGIQPEYFNHKYIINTMAVRNAVYESRAGYPIGNWTVLDPYLNEVDKLKAKLAKAEKERLIKEEAAKAKLAATEAAKNGAPEVVPTEAKKSEAAVGVDSASQPSSPPPSGESGRVPQRPPNGWGAYLADAIAELPPDILNTVVEATGSGVRASDFTGIIRESGL